MDSEPDGSEETLEQEDRLSTLPDDVLCNILSFVSTKYAARTSALSTRWRNLFASVPILDCDDFPYQSFTSPRNRNFEDFVSRALNLVLTTLSHIQKFRIRFHRQRLEMSTVFSWISNALCHNVQELEVVVLTIGFGPLPSVLFTCRTLVDLCLSGPFVLSVPDFVCMPRLKNLHLSEVILTDDDTTRRLLSGCPVLEELTLLCSMENIKVLDISIPSLKKLTLHSLGFSGGDYENLLNTPSLEYLKCSNYAATGYSGDILVSLVGADIHIEMWEDQLEEGKICELVNIACKVKFLSLSGDSMEALLHSRCSLPIFHKLTHLDLQVDYGDGWQLFPKLLECSPHLEVLIFDNGFLDDNAEFPGLSFQLPECVPTCLSMHLKVIRFNKFLGEEDEFKLVEYLLMNAEVLKKMIICPRSSIYWEEEPPSDLEEQLHSEMEKHFEIRKRLSTFQRQSQTYQIVLLEKEEDT